MDVSCYQAVSIVGLGKLGLPMACVFASKGVLVHGIDLDRRTVESISRGEYHGSEPQVRRMLSRYGERITVSTGFESVAQTWATFIVVPTPSDANDRFSLEHVQQATERVARELRRSDRRDHLIVLVSTVMPGACQDDIWPQLAAALGKTGNIELVYSPEFIALGQVVSDMLNPEVVLVGARSELAANRLTAFYHRIVDNQPQFHSMPWINAEITKLALNTLVSFKICSANLLAQVCEQLPGAHIDAVTAAIGSDTRVGRKYLRGGLGFGGPCFPRDVRAFTSLCQQLGVNAELPRAISDFNERVPGVVVDRVLSVLERRNTRGVAVLGLAYRPGTPVLESSQALQIACRLLQHDVDLAVFDPQVQAAQIARELPASCWAGTLESCIDHADVIVLATPDEHFARLPWSRMAGKTVIDCWRRIAPDVLAQALHFERVPELEYLALGVGEDQSTTVHPSQQELRHV